MNTYGTAIFGALVKVYDDIEDNPVIAQYNTPKLMELIKALVIASFTYASINNMNLPLFTFIFHCFHYVISDDTSLSTNFYHAGMIIALLLSIITFDVAALNITTIVATILICMMLAHIDHKLFPEEHSWKKIIGRTLTVIGLIILLQFQLAMIDVHTILFYLGYGMMSVCMMTFAQCSETESPKELKETKEPSKEQVSEEALTSKEKDVRLQVE